MCLITLITLSLDSEHILEGREHICFCYHSLLIFVWCLGTEQIFV